MSGLGQRLLAILAGVIVSLLALALLAAAGFGLSWFVLPGASADRARAALHWGGPSALLAFALGGWVAVRLGRVPRRRWALSTGMATAIVSLLLLLGLADQFAGDAADPRSVYVALGIDEPVPPREGQVPAPITMPAEDAAASPANELARRRALRAVGYGAAALLLLVIASGIGGLAAHRPLATPTARHGASDGSAGDRVR